MDYIELDITISPYAPWNEILISELAEIGFESFTENDGKLQAYIPHSSFNEIALNSTNIGKPQDGVSISYNTNLIKSQNWNSVWEADFEPVIIEDKAIIKAPFHTTENVYEYEFIIQPQMSFGTGHHQTTYLISKLLLDKPLQNKSVLDVGTGTGILAIIAKKLGATQVIGTEIDAQSLENAKENSERNNLSSITFYLGDIDCVKEYDFDYIIANINKNVLKTHMETYAKLSKKGTQLILSGFYETDTEELINFAKKHNFMHHSTHSKESWAVLEFIYN